MLKFRMKAPDGVTLFGFGLTDENIKRLQEGEPIAVNLEEIGGSGRVMIFYGEKIKDLLSQVEPHIGEDTIIHGDPES